MRGGYPEAVRRTAARRRARFFGSYLADLIAWRPTRRAAGIHPGLEPPIWVPSPQGRLYHLSAAMLWPGGARCGRQWAIIGRQPTFLDHDSGGPDPNLDGPAGDLVWPGRDAERVRELLRPDGYEQALQIGNYCTGAPSRYGRP